MMTSAALALSGIFPPIPTPFDEKGDIDFAHLKENLRKWNRRPLAGYVIGGSSGEYVLQTENERVEVVKAAREEIHPDRLLIAGSGMESTQGTIELTRRMAEAGADAAIVVTPNYYKNMMSPPALEKHYRRVADSSPIPLLLYSVPQYTGLDLPAEAVIRLSRHSNIIGIKDSGGKVGKIGRLVRDSAPNFQVLAGSAGIFLPALAVGAVGVIAGLANIAADQMAELMDYFAENRMERAREIQLNLMDANSAVSARLGVPGLKAAMDLCGYYGGPVRPPLLPIREQEREALKAVLERAGIA